MPPKTVTTSGTPGRTFSTTSASLSETWSSLEMTTTASTSFSSASALRMARSWGSRREVTFAPAVFRARSVTSSWPMTRMFRRYPGSDDDLASTGREYAAGAGGRG